MNKTYKIDALPLRLVIGRQTETGVEMVQFDCTAWLSIWPDMEISIWPMRPGEIAAYPAIVERAGNIITWTITDVDTAVDGEGSVEVMGMADGKRKLSARAVTHILASGLGNTQERPEGARPWVDEVLDAAKRAEDAAAEAAEVSVHPPIIGDNGNWWLWDATANAYVDSGKPSQGAGGGSSDVAIDTTLSVPGAAADAAVVGGKIEELSEEIVDLDKAKADYFEVGDGLQMSADRVLSAVGDGSEGEYELIDDYTTTEEVNSIARTYQQGHKKIKIYMVVPAKDKCAGIFIANQAAMGYSTDMTGTNVRQHVVKYVVENGYMFMTESRCGNDGESTILYDWISPYPRAVNGFESKSLTSVEARVLNGGTFPVGTTMKIMAVRA